MWNNKKFYRLASIFLLGMPSLGCMHQEKKLDALPHIYDQAQTVVIGQAISSNREVGRHGVSVEYTRVAVVKALKGDARGVISVQTKSEASVLSARCCRIGRTYMFFLVNGEGNRFGLYSGQSSVLQIKAMR